METVHAAAVGDARALPLPDDSVELVVTSPPYPMVELWDDLFAELAPAAGEALADGDGERAFEAMHDALAPAWDELARVLVDGGVACVVVGDATRRIGEFALYPNHAELAGRLRERGLSQLPGLLWRKPTNSAAKFMGSGMLPPNAYPTLEHEHVLVFRAGGPREYEPGAPARYEGAYFWEERNRWFSDLWELNGTRQAMAGGDDRERSAAFPLQIPLRLVRMFSARGETVLDPFWGTGTTTLAAMHAARDSVGIERDPDVAARFDDRLDGIEDRSRERTRDRLDRHRAFAREHDLSYEAEHYDFDVRTKQERRIRLSALHRVTATPGGYRCEHVAVDDGD